MRTLSTTHALQNLDPVSYRPSYKPAPIKSVCRVGLILFLAAMLSPAAAWAALPIEAVQRSIQQRWAVANGGNNCTFPNRSDGASPGLYPVDGFYGADLNDPTRLVVLVADIESKVFSNLTQRYVLFTDLEGTNLGIYYNSGGGDYRFEAPPNQRVSAVISPAPPGSPVDDRLQRAEQALLLCRQMAFWIAVDTAQIKASEAFTPGPTCYVEPECGISYNAAADAWRVASWGQIGIILSTQIFGEIAGAGIGGGQGGKLLS